MNESLRSIARKGYIYSKNPSTIQLTFPSQVEFYSSLSISGNSLFHAAAPC